MEQFERLKQMKAALVDFLFRAHKISNLKKIFLFGSLIEGDVNKKSDIDLLLVFDAEGNPETGIELEEATKISLAVLKHYKIENNFSFVILNIKEASKTDKEFLIDIAKKGILVWDKGGFDFIKRHREARLYTLFAYSTKNLTDTNKRRMLRNIAKIVEQHGRKLGKGVILVEKKHTKEAEEMFKQVKAFYSKQDIFT